MGALYSITSRSDGQVLTAAIYNADHQNHVDNGMAAMLGGYSASVSEMQTTADPGESGSESLATSIAGELARLRFAIKEIRGTSQWYQSLLTKKIIPATRWSSPANSEAWRDDQSDYVEWFLPVPHDYASGDIWLSVFRRPSVSGSQVEQIYSTYRARENAALLTISSAVSANFTPADTNTKLLEITIAASNFGVGDILIWSLKRQSGDAMSGALHLDGAWANYTGYAGR